jgi:hypothetical protein
MKRSMYSNTKFWRFKDFDDKKIFTYEEIVFGLWLRQSVVQLRAFMNNGVEVKKKIMELLKKTFE